MTLTELYVENMRFIRYNNKSLDQVTLVCIETAIDTIKAILFSRYRWQ